MRARGILLQMALIISLSSMIVLPAGAAQGSPLGWQMLEGPVGPISHLAVDPQDRNQMYAVSRGRGLYKSSDGGVTWQAATDNLPPGLLSALYADPLEHRLYVALNPAESGAAAQTLWASDDRGATWEQVPLDLGNAVVRTITRDATGRYLLLGMATTGSDAGGHLYRSADNGSSWEQYPIGDGKQDAGDLLADLLSHPTDERRLLAVTEKGRVYATADGGQSWTAATGLQFASGTAGWARLARVPDQPDTIYLVRQAGDQVSEAPQIARSTDGGASWSMVSQAGLPAAAGTGSFLALPGALLLGLNTGAFHSTDGGTTWRLLEGPLSSGGAGQFAPIPGSRTEVLAATGYGLYASRDDGALWQALGTGLPLNAGVAGLITNPEQPDWLYALAGPGAAGSIPPALLATQDGGKTWQALWSGLPSGTGISAALLPHAPPTLFATLADGIARSTDGGITWQVSHAESQADFLAAGSSESGVVYGLGSLPGQNGGRLLRSRDGGNTWTSLAISANSAEEKNAQPAGLALEPSRPEHVWTAFAGQGVFESTDGGESWRPAGLDGKDIRWLSLVGGQNGGLYAGVTGDGIYRQAPADQASGASKPADWEPVARGLPAQSTVLAFLPDPRTPGTLWASRQGGGVYRSTDSGANWNNVAQGMGDNEVPALAIDYATPGGIFAGTKMTSIWSLRPNARTSPAPKAVDARIEIVWPHDGAPVTSARQANLGLRLFLPASLVPPPCSWTPNVVVWQAVDTSPAIPLEAARQRTVDGRPYPWWDLNDMDVRIANDPAHKMYYMVQVNGAATSTSIWAHGSDARTFFPQQDVPSGVATDELGALDARIEIVWPHDAEGHAMPVTEAPLANVAVALFKHGTRLSVPPDWEPPGMTLYGAWNQEIGRPLSQQATRQIRQSGAVTYPVWEFTNIPVALAADPANKLYLWAKVDGIETFPTLWTHGADARTNFPAIDQPIQGCVP